MPGLGTPGSTESLILSTADSYRDRPTREITKEQRELNRLRRANRLRGDAWWEFDPDTYSFRGSVQCGKLTGYRMRQVFPRDLDPEKNPVEPKLDNLVDRFCSFVPKDAREDFRAEVSEFLLWSRRSRTLDIGLRMERADGEIISVWVVAYSLWEGGHLQALVCQMKDIGKVVSPVGAGVAITKNEVKLKDVTKDVEKVKGLLANVKILWPLALAATVSLVDGIGLAVTQAKRLVDIVRLPITSVSASRAQKDEILPNTITAQDFLEALEAMRGLARRGTVTLAAYEAGRFPGRYRLLVQSSSRQDVTFGDTTSSISTTSSAQIAQMTDLHVAGAAFERPPTDTYIYSVPFTIQRPDGQTQIFFVEVESLTKDAKEIIKIKVEVAKLAAIIKAIFET